MSVQNLLNQFLGSANNTDSSHNTTAGISDTLGKLGKLGKLGSSIPGGLASGAAAGGIMALLVSNKSARKFAGTAATYGGAAVLGGLAYKALQNWQQNRTGAVDSQHELLSAADAFASDDTTTGEFQLALIKAMIAAAKADGHIDSTEQQRIFQAVEQMDIPVETKGMLFKLVNQDISIDEITQGISSIEQKSEVYLASCLVIDPDHQDEQAHLDLLATALSLPESLSRQLQWQAHQAISHQAA